MKLASKVTSPLKISISRVAHCARNHYPLAQHLESADCLRKICADYKSDECAAVHALKSPHSTAGKSVGMRLRTYSTCSLTNASVRDLLARLPVGGMYTLDMQALALVHPCSSTIYANSLPQYYTTGKPLCTSMATPPLTPFTRLCSNQEYPGTVGASAELSSQVSFKHKISGANCSNKR